MKTTFYVILIILGLSILNGTKFNFINRLLNKQELYLYWLILVIISSFVIVYLSIYLAKKFKNNCYLFGIFFCVIHWWVLISSEY